MLFPVPHDATDEDAFGETLSHDQLRFLAGVRRRVPSAELRWHRRGSRLLLDVRAPAHGGRGRSVLVARFGDDGAVELDRPVSGVRPLRRERR